MRQMRIASKALTPVATGGLGELDRSGLRLV
jgi:hypothetical protein